MKAIILIAALSLCTGGFALAQPIEIPPSAASPAPNSKDDGEKIICRDDQQTGHRYSTRVCHTKSQWAAMGEFGRSQVEASQQSGPTHTCASGAC